MGQRDKSKALVNSVCGEIKSLTDTQAAILRNKDELEAKREHLLQELRRVNQDIDTADHDLSQIPSAITKLEGERQKQPANRTSFTRVCGRFLAHHQMIIK